jgi:hypothetical protein
MVLMSDEEKERIVLDEEPSFFRRMSGMIVIRVPPRWKRRRDTKPLFESPEVDVKLIYEGGAPFIEIRKVKESDRHQKK